MANEEDLDAILRNSTWVRSLAHALVHDPELAEDAAQDALLAALRRRPDASSSLRHWFQTVILRGTRRFGLREGQRRSVEQSVSGNHSTTSTLDLVSRLDAHRMVVHAVESLDEPYRTAVLLRYFEGHTPTRIARDLQVPVATVKTRLSRALDKLRSQLDRTHRGERSAWMVALLHFDDATPRASVWYRKRRAIVGMTAAASVALFLPGWFRSEQWGREGESTRSSGQKEGALANDHQPSIRRQFSVGRTTDRSTRVGSIVDKLVVPIDQVPSGVGECGVRVVTVGGGPQSGVELEFVPDSFEALLPPRREETCHSFAWSDERGCVEVPSPSETGFLRTGPGPWATVAEARYDPHQVHALEVVVAPAISIAGKVVDELGQPVPRARLDWLPAPGLDLAQAGGSRQRRFRESSDDQGRFRFAVLPSLPDSRLEIRAEGFEVKQMPSPAASCSGLPVELKALDLQQALSGTVTTSQGVPLSGAWIWGDGAATQTTDDGRFTLPFPSSSEPWVVHAAAPGFLPVQVSVIDFQRSVEWQLVESSATLRGRVVGSHGQGVAEAWVGLLDPTVLSISGSGPTDLRILECFLAGKPHVTDPGVSCDSEGFFNIEGLDRRTYDILVVDIGSLRTQTLFAIHPETENLEIEIAGEGLLEEILGRVVDRRGQPVEGALVSPFVLGTRLEHPTGESVLSHSVAARDGCETDELGWFELGPLARDRVLVAVTGEGILPSRSFSLLPSVFDSHEDLEIVVTRIQRAVLHGDPHRADTFVILDARDQPLNVGLTRSLARTADSEVREATMWASSHQMPSGPTELQFPDDARTLQLLRDGDEIGRHVLAVEKDSVIQIRL